MVNLMITDYKKSPTILQISRYAFQLWIRKFVESFQIRFNQSGTQGHKHTDNTLVEVFQGR